MQVTDIVLHAIYNRLNREITIEESFYAMLYVGKSNKKKFALTKVTYVCWQKVIRKGLHQPSSYSLWSFYEFRW